MNPLHKDFLEHRFPVLGALCVFLGSAFFSYAAVFDLDLRSLYGEGGVIEVSTAACLFLASLLLFATAKQEKAHIRRGAYFLGSLVMAFSCLEEMNWGQHIFGFTAPDFVGNEEFSIHNTSIGLVFLRYALDTVPLLLGILVCGAWFARKDKLLGIPLPQMPLMLGFLLIIFPEYLLPDSKLWSMLSAPGVLLLTALLFMLFSGQVRHSTFTAALLTMPAASLYAGYRCDCNAWRMQFTDFDGALECLLALACLLYAAELWRAVSGNRKLRTLFGGRSRRSSMLAKPPGGKAAARRLAWNAGSFLPRSLRQPWLLGSALMAATSFGLAVSAHFAYRTTALSFTEDLSEILAVEPVIRSEWEIRIMDNSLVYFREPCKPADTYGRFKGRVHPRDPSDLPVTARTRGFQTFRFSFLSQKGVISDGKCLVRKPIEHLDISAISHIEISQRIPEDNRVLWQVKFSPSQ